ncbi:HWE histidine kinase domain-containing protein [Rhizobium tumorigenes]|uniref:HWE histidine kinase domain-containing protein n=1 Tax=Rhizobium tumorigenes TaxID=2041385 RepID=UPI003100D636
MDTQTTDTNLSNCDREPIHIPGSIQPHGAMLVVEAATGVVQFASVNIAEYLDTKIELIIGETLNAVVGSDVAHQIGNAAAKAGYGHVAGVVLSVPLGGRLADITIHKHQNRIFVEFEAAASIGDTEIALSMTQALVRRIDNDNEVNDLVKSVAKLVRALLGYDRVMVYQFLHNGAGRVVAEAKAPEQQSFLGQHFPYADIPAQARKLYRKNWTRLIADVSFEPVPLSPLLTDGQSPIDMSYAHLRSVSPIHCQYLQNMGVSASMSISVVIGDELWGLIACHHDSPKKLSIPLRVATELFAQYFSLQIAAAESRQFQRATAYANRRLDAIVTTIDPGRSIEETLHERLKELSTLIACDGAAIWSHGEWTALGTVPSQEEVEPIMDVLRIEARNHIWETQELSARFPQSALGGRVAGLLAIPVSATRDTYLLLFRSEEAHEIEWAGEPGKQTISSPFGDRLTPRASFETWREDVRGRSLPWTIDNKVVAESVRSYLRDIVTGQLEAAEAKRSRSDGQRELLNAELNHRNKNVLALVKSIAKQTGIHTSSYDEFATSFAGRLDALSYAHDMSFAGHDGGELRALIDAEASMHRFQQLPHRFYIRGPSIALSAHAFSVFALLLHEMMTNAAKFGSLSAATGVLEISWQLETNGDCVLTWRETGGPTVTPPTRKGFGSTLIDKTIVTDLGGTADLHYDPIGLRASFRVPAIHLHLVAPRALQRTVVDANVKPLLGLSILLVEDQALIAMDMEEMLLEIGASEVITSHRLDDALEVLRASRPDAAVLDFNLGKETSEAIAVELRARNIPFIFSTGYREGTGIPIDFASAPVVRKPASVKALSAALQAAFPATVL